MCNCVKNIHRGLSPEIDSLESGGHETKECGTKDDAVYATHYGSPGNAAGLGIIELSNSLNGINYVTNSNIRPSRVCRVGGIGSLQEPSITAADPATNSTADATNDTPPRRYLNIEVSNPRADEADEKLNC